MMSNFDILIFSKASLNGPSSDLCTGMELHKECVDMTRYICEGRIAGSRHPERPTSTDSYVVKVLIYQQKKSIQQSGTYDRKRGGIERKMFSARIFQNISQASAGLFRVLRRGGPARPVL